MARTELPTSALVLNGSVLDPTPTTADATNGHVINKCDPRRTVLRVYNTAVSAKTVTIKAGTYPPSMAAGQGDLVVSVAASAIRVITFESGRFMRSDGTVNIDLESGFTGSLTALLLPKGMS